MAGYIWNGQSVSECGGYIYTGAYGYTRRFKVKHKVTNFFDRATIQNSEIAMIANYSDTAAQRKVHCLERDSNSHQSCF